MPRKESKDVREGNDDPVPEQEKLWSGQPTLADVYRMMEKFLDRSDRKLDELAEEMRVMDQRVASLEQDARQPHLAMVADGQADTKTRERTEGAATTVQAIHGNNCTANWVDTDPICSTSFGDDCTEPPALPCSRENALVDNGAAAPNWKCAHQ